MIGNPSLLSTCAHFRFPAHLRTRIIAMTILVLFGSLAWVPRPSLSVATLPPGFADTVIVANLVGPTAMAIAPDGRIFVCQQKGQLRVVKNDVLLPTPFVTLSVDSTEERGLLGVAFDPDFATNQFVYVYYTTATARNRVSRFTANGDVAVPGSEALILDIGDFSNFGSHNGGALHFGPDGKLYVAVGENTIQPDAQTLTNLKGKVLRINPDGTIPTDNPFYLTASGDNRSIWALGLRNPFTFAIQPGTGRMFLNDVGLVTREEINDGIAGSNYGWPTCEGLCNPPNPNFRDPIYAYGHSGGACAITGGVFYNPATARFPSLYVGKYFFADFCAGWIKFLDPATNVVSDFATLSSISYVVDLDVSANGDLYYLQRGNGGALGRIAYTANQAPAIAQHPSSLTATVGQAASFSVSASGTPPLSYQWQRDGASIAGATSATYTIAATALSDNGARFRCVVSNAFGTATSNEATLTVTTNQPPTATITLPAVGTLYQGGQTINYAGTGSDPETGNLAASAFTWQVDFHHDTHTHPFVPPTSGATGGSFVIPSSGETSVNVWYRIHLTVTDPFGLSHSVYRDILPHISTFTLQTSPPGLQLTLDSSPTATPTSVQSVVGMSRTLGVVSPQTLGGETYQFVSWSDGGAASHNITTPASNTTYTATFGVAGAGAGDGLSGTYYDNPDFTGATVTRIDPTIDFSWGATAPVPGFGPDTYSVRWTGQIQAQFSQTYTFYTQTNDGIRLWVNYQLIINNWTDHALTENSGTITLVAGQKYDIRIEFYYNYGGAAMHLLWSSPSTPKMVVPQSQLFSTPAPPPPGCTYSINPSSRTIASAGGTGTVSVTAGAGCQWTAVSNAPWITVTAGSSGSGNGSVSYSVAANTGPQRVGTITIAGQTFTLTQSSGCAYSISPTSQSFPASGGVGTANVTAGAGCSWTAKSNNTGWITITAGSSGTGNGTVSYSVKPRTGGSRTGSMTIAGIRFTVNQAGSP
jgi:glucose/arabinose dehydrogenase